MIGTLIRNDDAGGGVAVEADQPAGGHRDAAPATRRAGGRWPGRRPSYSASRKRPRRPAGRRAAGRPTRGPGRTRSASRRSARSGRGRSSMTSSSSGAGDGRRHRRGDQYHAIRPSLRRVRRRERRRGERTTGRGGSRRAAPTSVPMWSATSKVFFRSRRRRSRPSRTATARRSGGPTDEMGRNSERPWTIPRTMACRIGMTRRS